MWRRIAFCLLMTPLLLAVSPAVVRAGQPCPPPCPPAYQLVERTVMVPTYHHERRKIQVTECRPTVKEREVTIYKPVAQINKVKRVCTVMVPQTKMRNEQYTVCRTSWTEETRQYTVGVPEMQKKTGVRTVCRPVAVQTTRAVCEDHGHWETRPCGCGCCGTTKVWVPQIVTRQVPITVYKPHYVEESYQYSVCVMRPVTRTCTVKVPHHSYETKTRQVPCTVFVPKEVERTVEVVTYKPVPVKQIERCTVMVPYTVEKEILVPVCKMVPKKIVCKVQVSCCY